MLGIHCNSIVCNYSSKYNILKYVFNPAIKLKVVWKEKLHSTTLTFEDKKDNKCKDKQIKPASC